MTVSFYNDSLTCSMSSLPILHSLECRAYWNNREVTMLPGSRLAQDREGSVFLVPEPPFKVLGEIISPLVVAVYRISYVFSKIPSFVSELSIIKQTCRPADVKSDPFNRFKIIYHCLNQAGLDYKCDTCVNFVAEYFANNKCERVDLKDAIMSALSTRTKNVPWYPDFSTQKEDLAALFEHRLSECLSRT